MTTMLDLGPPAQQLTTLLEGLTDDQLAARTPCERSTVGDLLDHLMGLTLAFTFAAQKAGDPAQSSSPPEWSVRNLAPDWRTDSLGNSKIWSLPGGSPTPGKE